MSSIEIVGESYATVADLKYLLDEVDAIKEQIRDVEARDDGDR